jgi:hypothetical protein
MADYEIELPRRSGCHLVYSLPRFVGDFSRELRVAVDDEAPEHNTETRGLARRRKDEGTSSMDKFLRGDCGFQRDPGVQFPVVAATTSLAEDFDRKFQSSAG